MRALHLNRAQLLMFIGCAVVVLAPPDLSLAQRASLGSISSSEQGTVPGQEPTPKEIEAAYNECLRQIDQEAQALTAANTNSRQLVIQQTEFCKKGKTDCIMAVRGVNCRSFVEDYAVEAFAE
jgi:hypothetical protein